jgi:hypothetical protein
MSSRDLRVDPTGVHAAGATLGGAAGIAVPGAVAVTPCAGDAASVDVAADLTARIGALNGSTAWLNLWAGASSLRLHASAETYAQQEANAAAGLGDTAATVGSAVLMRDVPTPPPPAAAPLPAAGGGLVPATGRQAAELIHGGPGPQPLELAAAVLDTQADNLDQAAASVRAARWGSEQSWDSDAAQQAADKLVRLESSYTGHASHARALSAEARTQVDNFLRAKAGIPAPGCSTTWSVG